MSDRICEVSECGRPTGKRGSWCGMHYMRWYRTGDPSNAGRPYGAGRESRNWRGDDVGYVAAHYRVRAVRGSASTHLCTHCGGQAEQWAYDHQDAGEKPDRRGLYSTNPEHYFPLCRPCHRSFDALHASQPIPGCYSFDQIKETSN